MNAGQAAKDGEETPGHGPMTAPEPVHLPPLGQHDLAQLHGWACMVCAGPVPADTQPLAEVPARYDDYLFTYRPTVCPACAPRIPRPVQLPALAQDGALPDAPGDAW